MAGLRESDDSPGPVRFDLSGTMGIGTWEGVEQIALASERLGFHAFHASDHLMPVAGSDRAGDFLEGWSLVAALAVRTRRIRLGVMVSGNTYRHPVMLAKIATTVDHISGGRMDFGIGTSWSELDHRPYGVPFPPFRERLERLEESLLLIKQLWTQPTSEFRGRYYQLTDAPFAPKPLQKPHPPITIGGSSEGVLRLVARHADVWNAVGTVAHLAERSAVLDRLCGELRRDPRAIERSVWIGFHPTETQAEADSWVRSRARELAARTPAEDPTLRYAAPGEAPEDIARSGNLVGTPKQICRQVEALVERGFRRIVLRTPRPFRSEPVERVAKRLLGAFA